VEAEAGDGKSNCYRFPEILFIKLIKIVSFLLKFIFILIIFIQGDIAMPRKKVKEKIEKNIPTIFPSGFGIKFSENSKILVLEFIDNKNDDSQFVVGSFAMDMDSFKSLNKLMTNAIKEEEKQ